MVESGLMSWSDVVDRMSIAPARIGGYSRHGGDIEAGAIANLTIIDADATWRVDREKLASKSKNTPFHDMELPAVVTHTIFNGAIVCANGSVREVA